MTFRAWPPVSKLRRAVIESRTPSGEACTIVVERQPDGPLLRVVPRGVADHGGTLPEELTMLIEALRTAGARCS